MTMGFRDDRHALEAKVRAQEAEIDRLRAEVAERCAPQPRPSGADELPQQQRRIRLEIKPELRKYDSDAPLPWWLHLLAYGAVALLAVLIAIRDCGGEHGLP